MNTEPIEVKGWFDFMTDFLKKQKVFLNGFHDRITPQIPEHRVVELIQAFLEQYEGIEFKIDYTETSGFFRISYRDDQPIFLINFTNPVGASFTMITFKSMLDLG